MPREPQNVLLVLTFAANWAIWISSVAYPTLAYCSMISGCAVGIDWAVFTGVNTFFIPACQVVSTLWIWEAFILPASLIGISLVAWSTLASCLVVPDTAFSIQATLFKSARVQAFSVVTGLYNWALIIRLAASCVKIGKDKLGPAHIPGWL